MVAVSLKKIFFKQKTAYEIGVRLVGSEMCIRDSTNNVVTDDLSVGDRATIAKAAGTARAQSYFFNFVW